jgi:hypothetical protein
LVEAVLALLVTASACASANGADTTAGTAQASSGAVMAAPAADHADVKRLCADLDSPKLDVRLAGGTEQQMEAAAAFCIKSGEPRPSWLPER